MSNYGSINDSVKALIQQQVTDGRQIGAQVCAYKDGVVVVDTCAGHMGPNDSRLAQEDSLFLSFSMTKGAAATVFYVLADKGLIRAREWKREDYGSAGNESSCGVACGADAF